MGFDVVDLYESVAKSLKEYGYTGLYVVYDEFSKYLEANIKEASVSDTKTLQDFAEKCNRSGSMQLHLMLISHKEISNYIDTLPKQKVDGWRGVSERFKHMGENPDDEARFDSYVRGGVDVLYEKLIEGASSPDDYVSRLYDFVEEFQERFNEDIASDEILKLCSK